MVIAGKYWSAFIPPRGRSSGSPSELRLISRRALLRLAGLALSVLAVGEVPSATAADEEIKEADKIKQTDAHYQTRPNRQQRCEICLQFLQPDKCKIVQGPISLRGWCQFFTARENAH
jgi:hypothetical protein